MTTKEIHSTFRASSFCCVLNNVDKLFDKSSDYFNDRFKDKTKKRINAFRNNLNQNAYTPEEIVDYLMGLWIGRNETSVCAVNYEIGDNGTHHCHMVLEDKQSFRFSTLQTLFPTIHAEITRGTKEEVLAYFEKSGKHEEKAHTIVVPMKLYGELRANQQGQRSDLDYIQRRIEEGSTPEEIMIERLEYRKYTKMIKEHYYQFRVQNTPDHKDLKVYWHTGDSGSGKSYTQVELKREFGREAVYVWSDYQNGGLDGYQGESILFMEEYKAELPYAEFLKVTDRYPQQMHARYSNVYALWNTIHLTSIFPPKKVYELMVPKEKRSVDTVEQMMRRISKVVYHFKVITAEGKNLYKQLIFSVKDYNNYSQEQIERFAYQFDRSNPNVLVYDFEKDDCHSTKDPIGNK